MANRFEAYRASARHSDSDSDSDDAYSRPSVRGPFDEGSSSQNGAGGVATASATVVPGAPLAAAAAGGTTGPSPSPKEPSSVSAGEQPRSGSGTSSTKGDSGGPEKHPAAPRRVLRPLPGKRVVPTAPAQPHPEVAPAIDQPQPSPVDAPALVVSPPPDPHREQPPADPSAPASSPPAESSTTPTASDPPAPPLPQQEQKTKVFCCCGDSPDRPMPSRQVAAAVPSPEVAGPAAEGGANGVARHGMVQLHLPGDGAAPHVTTPTTTGGAGDSSIVQGDELPVSGDNDEEREDDDLEFPAPRIADLHPVNHLLQAADGESVTQGEELCSANPQQLPLGDGSASDSVTQGDELPLADVARPLFAGKSPGTGDGSIHSEHQRQDTTGSSSRPTQDLTGGSGASSEPLSSAARTADGRAGDESEESPRGAGYAGRVLLRLRAKERFEAEEETRIRAGETHFLLAPYSVRYRHSLHQQEQSPRHAKTRSQGPHSQTDVDSIFDRLYHHRTGHTQTPAAARSAPDDYSFTPRITPMAHAYATRSVRERLYRPPFTSDSSLDAGSSSPPSTTAPRTSSAAHRTPRRQPAAVSDPYYLDLDESHRKRCAKYLASARVPYGRSTDKDGGEARSGRYRARRTPFSWAARQPEVERRFR